MRFTCLHRLVPRGLLCLAALSLVAGSGRAQSAVPGMAVPSLPIGALDSGAVPAAQKVTLTVYLQLPVDRAAALDTFLTAVQTPGSAQYRQWLTPASFAQSFGATADQVAAVQAWAGQQGLSLGALSRSGTSVTVTGTAAQVETALAPGLHSVQVSGQHYLAYTAVPTLPDALTADVLAVDGLNTVPGARVATVSTEAARAAAPDLLASVSAVVEANSSRILSIASTQCVEDVDTATAGAMHLLLKEAAAEGITTLVSSGCNGRGAASYPGSLAEVISVATPSGITPATAPTLTELRPDWQSATGLPQDGFRYEPDLTVSSLAALESTVMTILAKQPVLADGSAARLGNIAGKLYTMVDIPGLYTQPDGAAAGTWETATGLGVTDLDSLAKHFPNGTTANTVTILPTDGQTFTSTYGDTVSYTIKVYGSGGITPSGTVSVSFSPGGYTSTAPITLVNGQATFSTSQLNAVPAANTTTYTITATYNGDTTYASDTGSTKLYVGPQALTINASTAGTPPVGGSYTVSVSLTAKSGVPTGTVTISPANTTAKTLSFTGTNSQATVSANFTANQQGSIYIPVTCTTDSNYSCAGTNTTVYAVQGTPTVAVTISPNPVQTGQATTLSATVTLSGGVAPTGQVAFTDASGTALCTTPYSGGIKGSVSCSASNVTGTSGTITGTYSGDANYASATGSAQYTASLVTTKVTLNTISNPVVAGTTITLAAGINPVTTLNNQPPTGTITFYDGTTVLSQQTLGYYQYSVTAQVKLTTLGTHSIYAKYSGDSNYGGGSSDPQSVTVGPATSVTLTAAPTGNIVYGNNVILTAKLTATPNDGSNLLSGSLKFNINGTDFATQTVGLTSATSTTATAVVTVTQALSAGTYTVNLYCVTNNFDCGSINTSGFSFTIVKADTTTAVQLSTGAPTAGQSVTATATVAPAIAATGTSGVITGTVTFFDNATNVGTFQVNGGTATSSAFTLTSASDNIVAVYNGDGNNNSSKSTGTTSGGGGAPVMATSTSVTANPLTVLSGGVSTLTATVIAYPVTGSTTAGSPTGTVNFYDNNNGTQFLLGSALLTASGANTATATLPTTSLRDNANTISAAFQGSTSFTASSSTTSVVVQVTDFGVSFTPTTLAVTAGNSATVTAAVNAINGFTGQVTLGCTAPSGTGIGCSFDQTTITTSGLAKLTITTTTRTAGLVVSHGYVEAEIGGVGAVLLCLLLPAARRRRMRLLGVVLFLALGATLSTTLGCTELTNPPTGSGLGSGTPAGSEVVTITASGTDGVSTVRHTYTVTVNVQ